MTGTNFFLQISEENGLVPLTEWLYSIDITLVAALLPS